MVWGCGSWSFCFEQVWQGISHIWAHILEQLCEDIKTFEIQTIPVYTSLI